jgi:endonuclease/exonuclease/phosphatase (EEP) superfamily protein YafD
VHRLPGPTWTLSFGVPAMARIDGVLVPDAWPVLDAWTVEVDGSDHRAVVADVRLPAD